MSTKAQLIKEILLSVTKSNIEYVEFLFKFCLLPPEPTTFSEPVRTNDF